MNIHEYQAKNLFADYGLPVSTHVVCKTPDEVKEKITQLQGNRWVVKAQVHAGGRGKAGGVKLVDHIDEAVAFAKQWLGQRMVTFQTDADGQPVHEILIEECVDISQELYIGAVIDRASKRVVFMASSEGGVEIEKVAEESPEKIIKIVIDPMIGPQAFQGRQVAYSLGLSGLQTKQFVSIYQNIVKLFIDNDLALLEVNPLVITQAGQLHCLDAKVNIDGNALYRQPKLRELHDPSQEDDREQEAGKWGLNYVALDGDIGCMVNGAGLAMATMDLIKLHGGAPANFLDVGGGATQEKVTEAFKIILADSNVKAVLINIFGGIVRCDLIADGVIAAIEEVGVHVPVVVRLAGNNAELGRERLAKSGLNIIAAPSFDEACQKVVEVIQVKGE